ncbi:MAG: hypothetical protein EA418_13120 [Wenzhouxiangellaceae bacterium]|nr:MAG: hypothetical protein EA418_13120 [Wenzhouxiangellaceae bacterium]
MNKPIRTTFLVALGLMLAAAFPLLGLMTACLIAGMGLHAVLAGKPPGSRRLPPPEAFPKPPSNRRDQRSHTRRGNVPPLQYCRKGQRPGR